MTDDHAREPGSGESAGGVGEHAMAFESLLRVIGGPSGTWPAPPAEEPALKTTAFLDQWKTRGEERDFENAVVAWTHGWTDECAEIASVRAVLENPDEVIVVPVAAPTGGTTSVRYAEIGFPAYFALCSYYRRRKRYEDFAEVVKRFGQPFSHLPLYHHLNALLYVGVGTREAFRLALAFADEARKALPDHPGVLHSYASTVAAAAEARYPVTPSEQEAALQAVNRSISRLAANDPGSGKFHATCARLHAIQGDYESAYAEIKAAIEKEPRNPIDYGLRIAETQMHFAKIQLKEQAEQVTRFERLSAEQVLRFEGIVDDIKKESLTILAIFSAVVSIAVGSFALISDSDLDFQSAAGLVVILAFTLLVLYAGFNVLFLRPRSVWPSIVTGTLGLLFIAGAYLIVLLS